MAMLFFLLHQGVQGETAFVSLSFIRLSVQVCIQFYCVFTPFFLIEWAGLHAMGYWEEKPLGITECQ